jgi:hypothetical protein
MRSKLPKVCTFVSVMAALAIFSIAAPYRAQSQDDIPKQIAGVDQTAMGPYRAIAQLAFRALQKKNYADAATLVRILEMTWDKGESNLAKNNKQLFEEIDAAMDAFIKPILAYKRRPPDLNRVHSTYTEYLRKLELADR